MFSPEIEKRKMTSAERMRKYRLRLKQSEELDAAVKEKDRLRKTAARQKTRQQLTAAEKKANREYEREKKRRQRAAKKFSKTPDHRDKVDIQGGI